MKLSEYKKGEPWCEIVDALYWRFLYKYSSKFNSNPRMKMQIALLNKMSEDKLQKHLKIANDFTKNLFIAN